MRAPHRRVIVVAVFVIVAAVGTLFALSFVKQGRALEASMRTARADLSAGRWDEARNSLNALMDESVRFESRLRGPLPSLIGRIPFLGRPLRTARAVLVSGRTASRAALDVLPALQGHNFFNAGRIDLAALDSFRDVAQRVRPAIREALRTIEDSPSWPLPGPVARARADLVARLTSANETTGTAGPAIELAKRVLGASGRRRYFIAFANPAENRGASGLWGNFGVLVVDHGKLSLGRFGRTQDELREFATNQGPDWYKARYERFGVANDWRQLPTAPDFPTVATIAEANVSNAPGIGPVDGTFAVDPEGLASLLRITGPVRVASWPEPLTAQSIVRTTMHDAYSHFSDNTRRVSFLGEAALAVWSSLVKADLSASKVVQSKIGSAVAQKHIAMHLTRPDEQRLATILHSAAPLGDPRRTFGLVLQNTAGHKMDYWLDHSVRIDLDLAKDGGASGQVALELRNHGPATGEPQYVIGPFDESFRKGWNYQLVRMYFPAGTAVALGTQDASISEELGFVVVEWNVAIPPGGGVKRRISFSIDHLWDPSTKAIDLVLRKQASVRPDDVRFEVRPPWGWRLSDPEPSCGEPGKTSSDLHVKARARPSLPAWIVGPWARQLRCGGGHLSD